MIERLLRPIFELAATLMANLFLAPFRALFGLDRTDDDDSDREEPEALDDEAPKQLPPPPESEDGDEDPER